jgi:hypothetical protein
VVKRAEGGKGVSNQLAGKGGKAREYGRNKMSSQKGRRRKEEGKECKERRRGY